MNYGKVKSLKVSDKMRNDIDRIQKELRDNNINVTKSDVMRAMMAKGIEVYDSTK